ncbi:MAG: septum formation inhibitor MinC [Candidatus Electrothrix sp. AR4]|nr:septum formation inhibitor MinC [Candidatus Electrothrix sp. AR4]
MGSVGSKGSSSPFFFHNAPVVINLRHVPDADQYHFDLALFLDLVRSQGFIPVGITGATEQQQERAEAMKLAVLTTRGGGKQQEDSLEVEGNEPEEKAHCNSGSDSTQGEQAVSPASSFVITEPVRSGQRIAVDQGDLIVMASVSSGAEITTPGNVHVYGALRGRAFAGNNGDATARIFCQRLEAELVAVAGVYLVNENFPAALRSMPVQIYLQAGRIRIKAL